MKRFRVSITRVSTYEVDAEDEDAAFEACGFIDDIDCETIDDTIEEIPRVVKKKKRAKK